MSKRQRTERADWKDYELQLINDIKEGLSLQEIIAGGDYDAFSRAQIATKISNLKKNKRVDGIETNALGPNKTKVEEVLKLANNKQRGGKEETEVITPFKYKTPTCTIETLSPYKNDPDPVKPNENTNSRPVIYFLFNTGNFCCFFVKKNEVCFDRMNFFNLKGVEIKLKIEERGLRVLWFCQSPSDEFVMQCNLNVREFHFKVTDSQGDFLISSPVPLETNPTLAKFNENDNFKLLQVPHKLESGDTLF